MRFDRAVAVLGALGLVLAAGVASVILIRGNDFIPPEGELMKALTFDGAIGIYYLTLAFYVPLARFSARGRLMWLASAFLVTLYGYSVETTQILRGIDPRFSEHGTSADDILGGLFGLSALGQIVVFVVLWERFLRQPGLLPLSIGYAGASVMLAFAAGVAMTVVQGRGVGDGGNLLILHATGFHALQAIPLLAWLLERSGRDEAQSRRSVHTAGAAWFAMCTAIAAHTFAGRAPDDPTLLLILAVLLGLVWAALFGLALLAWRRAGSPLVVATR